MKEIACLNGAKALVDDDMYEALSQYTWKINRDGYAYTLATKGWANPTILVMMHHCVIGRSLYNLVADHINRNKLDNRRENLRHVNMSMNALNCKRYDGSQTKPKPSVPQWADRTHIYQPRPVFQDRDLTPQEVAQWKEAISHMYGP